MYSGIRVEIGAAAGDDLKRKCIGENDVVSAVTNAERNRTYFEDGGGARICALRLENLTYWVEYEPRGGNSFEIKNAYFHRMSFEETV